MVLTRRMDLVVFMLMIFLACLIGYNGIYKTSLKNIANLEGQIEEEKKKNELLAIVGGLDKRIQTYQGRFFPSTELTPVLDRISQSAKQVGITIESFDHLPPTQKEQFIELSVNLPLSCEYHKLGEFLSLIESNPEVMMIKQLNMQKPTVTDPKRKTTPKVSLTISGLYLKP